MEIIAHGLWAAAACVVSKRSQLANPRVATTVWWAAFPDVLAFGPSLVIGIGLRIRGIFEAGASPGGQPPHAHLGLPLYPAGHSIVMFCLVFGITTLIARRVVVELFGWLLHILIDIPTHSLNYYATRFLWPASDFRIDGIPWWTPWLWVLTYGLLGLVYVTLLLTRHSPGRRS